MLPTKNSGISIDVTEVDIPNPDDDRRARDKKRDATPKRRAARKAWKKSDKGKAYLKDYKHRTSTWATETSYLARPFVAWDGEGITVESGDHLYTLLSNSVGMTIRNPDGLGSMDIFAMLIDGKERAPDGIHIIYGGSYDFNMWFRDLPRDDINRLYETGRCLYGPYKIVWRRGKSLRVTDRERGITITMYDVVSFFQCAFVKACDDYLGDRFENRDMIVANKAARGTFTADDDETVDEYNQAELRNLVALMTELRLRLVKVHLRPRRWDGPGAIATALLQREGIKKAMAVTPKAVAEAARYAYSGGRFEVIQCGDVDAPAYEYDINSAYPAALRTVPNLARGEWKRVRRLPRADEFGVFRVDWVGEQDNYFLPQPFFARGPQGTVGSPLQCSGWYWTPEVLAGRAYAKQYGGTVTVCEGWVFVPDDVDDKPFAFIDPMYLKRQALKKAKDGAHVGLKLGLNSLYGKTCQRVGFSPADGDQPAKPPPFHQLEWAGYVTSWCRAEVLRAALEDLSSVIAFETDALFTTRPLTRVTMGTELGEWEYTLFDRLCYVQSGTYFGVIDGTPFAKTRGVDRDTMTYAHVRAALDSDAWGAQYVEAALTRFIGVGLARQLNDWTRWTRWETAPKRLLLEPSGKRTHVPTCDGCGHDNPLLVDKIGNGNWHETMPQTGPAISHQYPIPWINPNPQMIHLDDYNQLRREDQAADYE